MIDYKKMRATMPKIAEDVVIRNPQVFVAPNFTNGAPTLSKEEVSFFKENGFLVKRGFLNEPDTFQRIVEHVWQNVPRGLIKRDDVQTWINAPHGQWTEADGENLGLFSGGAWKMRSRNGIGTEPFLLDKIGNHPQMRKLVAQFIGEPVKHLQRVRGVYGVFPKQPGTAGHLSPHADQSAAQLSAMVVVDEIPPHCGGFTVWPGSHHIVHPHAKTIYGPVGQEKAEAYGQARDQALRDITPIELWGNAGDVIFWHPRLIHSGGINCSAEYEKPVLRLIVPCDYQQDGLTYYDDLIEGPGPNHQWWVDARNFREDIPATPNNIWHDWVFTTS
jgi:hypothetical protein